jgi:hypothetical protein
MRTAAPLLTLVLAFLPYLPAYANPADVPSVCGVILNAPVGDLSGDFDMKLWGQAFPKAGSPREVWIGKLLDRSGCTPTVAENPDRRFRDFDLRVSVIATRIRAFEHRVATGDCSSLLLSFRPKYGRIATERSVSVGPRQGVEWRMPSGIIVSLDYYPAEDACWFSAYFERQ